MAKFIRFIVTTDHPSQTRCTGVVASLRIAGEEGQLPAYHMEYAEEIFSKLNRDLPCPPFDDNSWRDCVSWFKNIPSSHEWISLFRDIIAILEDSDFQVRTLMTDKPGMIVYEDEFQVVTKSREF